MFAVNISSNFKFESFHAGVVALFLHCLKTILQLLIVGQELKKQFAI